MLSPWVNNLWGKPQSGFNILFLTHVYLFDCTSLCCSMWDLAPWPGIEPVPPASGVLCVSHWTTREVSQSAFNVLPAGWLIRSTFAHVEHQNEECEGEVGTAISQAKPSATPPVLGCFWCGLDHRAVPSHRLCAIHPAPQTTQQSSRGCGAHPELVWNDGARTQSQTHGSSSSNNTTLWTRFRTCHWPDLSLHFS